ncbi:MAG: hypothetical protein FWG70_10845, partial [Oscillospiraceae bacterium]|nr:hypothetical protein [Oscillospiraceae bacterium]
NNGLLVRDINGNGKIDSGRELFGNYTLLKNGKQAANGFEALKELVEVGASVFDNTSPYWNEVMVWIDANSNGITDPDELLTLEEAGVVSIDLSYYVANITDENGNVHREVGTFTRDDESIGDAVDVWFAHYAVESKAVSNLPVSEDVELLPDLTGLGTAYSLHQAIMRDESGQLQSLVEQFAAENDESARRVLARQIMFKWTGKTTTLAALEVITGEKYTGGTGTNAMKIINDAFDRFVDTVYDVLLAQSHLWYLYETMMEQIPDEEGYIIADDYIFDLTDVAYELLNEILNNQETGERQFLELIRNMYGLILLPRVDLNSMREVLEQENTKYGYVLDSLNKPLIHNQSSNNLKGTNSGNLFWLDGKNNSIQIGNGDDTFLFFGDMGQNTITDGGGNNTIIFFNGINQSDISVNQVLIPNNTKALNLEISILGTGGKITIKDFNYASSYKIAFADGSMVECIDFINPIEIGTAQQLDDVRNNLLGYYRLTADLDLTGIDWTPIGTNSVPFNGSFDGNGFTVSNLSVNLPATDYVGLFGRNNGVIKNTNLENVNVTGRNYVGGLAGSNSGLINNSSVSGVSNVTGTTDYIGGFVGSNSGRILNSFSTVTTQGKRYVGGFAGNMTGGLIDGCYATGNANASGSSAGGFVGRISGASSIIRNCYSIGNVSDVSFSGGFVGYVGTATVRFENCYTTSIHSNGFSGDSTGVYLNCYFDKELSLSASTRGRTTEQMQNVNTYVNWDFESIWEIDEGNSYPTLRALQVNHEVEYIEIHTIEQFNAIRNNLGGNYRLTADIDLSGYEWTPIGTNVSPFIGIFDGNGHKISNLTINRSTSDYLGLFGRSGGLIKNFDIENVNVTGRNFVSSVVGYNTGIITNVTVTGVGSLISGKQYASGFIGSNAGQISKSYTTVGVKGTTYVGGFSGVVIGGVIDQCYATGNVTASDSRAGGFAGRFNGGSITVRNCYSTGTVSNVSYSGGFIGEIVHSTSRIENSYTTSNHPKGFSGDTIGVYENCFFDNNRSLSKDERGRTTAQMQNVNTYVNWDFENVWEIDEGNSYPTLRGVTELSEYQYQQAA